VGVRAAAAVGARGLIEGAVGVGAAAAATGAAGVAVRDIIYGMNSTGVRTWSCEYMGQVGLVYEIRCRLNKSCYQ
jgi:hypothetical protein